VQCVSTVDKIRRAILSFTPMCCFEAARANENEIGKRIRECASSIRTFYFPVPKGHYAPIAALEAEHGFFCLKLILSSK